MDTVRNMSLVAAAVLIICGSIAVVVLELTSSAERRLVPAWRDTIEVLLPPAATLVLLYLVWLDWL
jgi:hypothetical protein